MQQIVVVGASLAGLRSAQALRKRGFAGSLVVVGDEPHATYDRPPLSKQFLTGEWPSEKLFFAHRESHAALNIEWRLGQRATQLDVQARRIAFEHAPPLAYDGLVIATGATPRTLPEAAGLSGVFTLRTLDDARAISARLAQGPRVAIVGAGFIGLEVAASCRKLGLSVTVIEPQALPLQSLLGPRVGAAIQQMHVEQGVRFCTGVSVAAVSGEGRVERILLSDGANIEADLLVVGIGVVPETRWLEGSGVALSNGVLCDATLATNVPKVVAAGDVVRWPNGLFGETARVEHWSNAVEQAAAAAARLLDGDAAPAFVHAPYFWSDQYQVKLQCAGRVRGDDTLCVVAGALNEPAYVALYGRAGRLTGVLTSNRPAHFLRYRKLLSERTSFEDACRTP
jgi:3-phenylpropionate/trans-cinnamate dioxygenase ferredoxin reductase component